MTLNQLANLTTCDIRKDTVLHGVVVKVTKEPVTGPARYPSDMTGENLELGEGIAYLAITNDRSDFFLKRIKKINIKLVDGGYDTVNFRCEGRIEFL